jgi:hypothetical protein
LTDVGVLPRSLAPLPDESLHGFLLRLAHRLDTSPLRLARVTGLVSGHGCARIPTRLMLEMSTHTATRFAAATRMSITEATALTLATLRANFPPVDPRFGFHRGRGGTIGRSVNGVFVQERWLLARSSRYCPHCLAGDDRTSAQQHGGAWSKLWHLPIVFACPTHHQLLEHRCPGCTQPALSRGNGLVPRPTSRIVHPAACRNRPAGTHPLAHQACGHRLDTVPTTEPNDRIDLGAVLSVQNSLLHLLRGDQATTSADLTATVAEYVTDLRVLACLITASWPAADTLFSNGGHADLIDTHVDRTRQRIDQARRTRRKARDHAHYDTPPAAAAPCAALLTVADAITRAGGPDTVRGLIAPLVAALPAGGHDWVKQFLHGRGLCSRGLQSRARGARSAPCTSSPAPGSPRSPRSGATRGSAR